MPPTRVVVLAAAALVAAAQIPGTVATAAAEPGAAASVTALPFGQALRRCDFSEFQYVGPGYSGRPSGQLRVEDGVLVADVAFVTGMPFTRYDVRLIQVPRESALPCNPGDPGVAEAVLMTDAAGTGATTVRAPVLAGATGVWASVTRPNPRSQFPEEFYTTDMVVDI